MPPGLMATIDWLQKWGWLLFAMALLIPVSICTMHESSPTYIPKSQHSPYKRLMGWWGQVLQSWIKKASKDISNWRATKAAD